MKKLTRNILIITIGILTFIIVVWWGDINFKERKKKNDMKIQYSGIGGKIEYVHNNHGWSEIKMVNQWEKIIIGNYITKSGKTERFLNEVQANDSLFSPANSDSIYVIRNGRKKGYKLLLDFGQF